MAFNESGHFDKVFAAVVGRLVRNVLNRLNNFDALFSNFLHWRASPTNPATTETDASPCVRFRRIIP